VSERIEQLRKSVEAMHKCKAVHDQSTPVSEMFGGKKVWEGVVEAFALSGHAKARRCYAWSSHDGKETQHVTVLEIPPVISPRTAVQAILVGNSKKN
jgi:hypothetical protein